MRRLIVLFVFAIGCGSAVTPTADGGPAPDGSLAPCSVPDTWVSGDSPCAGSKDGYQCVTLCGERPPDGGAGMLLAPGCLLQIGTTTPVMALCVLDCSECQ